MATQQLNILNLDTIKKAMIRPEPFPYMIIDNLIGPKFLPEIIETFPLIKKGGSFPLKVLSCKGAFAQLIEELQHPSLRTLIGKRFEMDLENKTPLITVRGYTTKKDGHINADSEPKLITFLLYLNQGWQKPEGRLRLLYNNRDLENYAAEVSPEAGRCLIFKVTPNCWHGHTSFVGERKSIQLNYVSLKKTRDRNRERLNAFLKKLKNLKTDESISRPTH